jgi:hypothetical protein
LAFEKGSTADGRESFRADSDFEEKASTPSSLWSDLHETIQVNLSKLKYILIFEILIKIQRRHLPIDA